MKKLTTLLLILLIGSLSHGQTVLYKNAPDRQKITEFEKRNDSLVISLENSGTNKVYIGDIAGVALGETSITAYRGDRGKTAYDHTSLSNNPHAVTKSQVGLGNVDNTSDANKPISTLTQTALNAKANINSPTFTGSVKVPDATLSTEAVNLGQMMDSLATIEVGSGITAQYMDSDKTLEQSDFGKYIYTDTSIELTIDNTPAVSSKIGLKVIDIDSTITVIPSGVTFIGDSQDISQGFIVDSISLATVFKLASNLYSVDGIYKPYVPPLPPANLYTLANAANPDSEVNATTGAGDNTRTTWSSVASAPSPQNGSYSLKMTYTGGTVTGQGRVTFSGLEIGQSYKVSFWAYEGQSTANGTIYMNGDAGWSVTDSTGSLPTGEWTYYELTGTPSTTTPSLYCYMGSSAENGNWIAIDNITIIEN